MSAANSVTEITLEEVARLIRMLGMLGSGHDGEVLNAARFVVRWIAEKETDWETLLVPEEPGVSGVAVAVDPDEIEGRIESAYQQGYKAGALASQALASQMAAHTRAQPQAGLAQQTAQTSQWASAFGNLASGLGAGLGASGLHSPYQQAQPAQGPVRPSGGLGGAPAGLHPHGPVRGNYAQGTWQWVCQELLDRAGAVPGVFRGTKEEIFVRDVLQRGFATLTMAQEQWLRDIAGRNGLSW